MTEREGKFAASWNLSHTSWVNRSFWEFQHLEGSTIKRLQANVRMNEENLNRIMFILSKEGKEEKKKEPSAKSLVRSRP